MNFIKLTGDKKEIWQSVSGIVRESYSKICSFNWATAFQALVDGCRQQVLSVWNSRGFALERFLCVSLILYTAVIGKAFVKSYHKTEKLRAELHNCAIEIFMDNYFHILLVLSTACHFCNVVSAPLIVKNLVIISIIVMGFIPDSFVSHSDKEYAREKFERGQTARKKQEARALKRLLKSSSHQKRRRLQKRIETLESHSLLTQATKWDFIKGLVLSQCSDPKAKKFLTSGLLCALTVGNCENTVAMVGSIMQFVNSEFASHEGIVMDTWNLLMSINGTEEVPLGDYNELQSHSTTQLIDQMQNMKSNWGLFRESPVYKKVHHFMCSLVALGLLDGKEYDLSVGNIELFAMDTRVKSMNALDALDAIINMLTYLVESGAYAFQKKSIKPFLFDDKMALEIDDEFARFGPMMDHLLTGNLELNYKLTEKDLEDKLTFLLDKINRAMQTVKGPPYQILQRKKEIVARWVDKVIDSRIACGTREAPFSPVLIGDSNIGKTTLTQIFAREIGTRQGFNTSARYQSVIQGNDKFWTSYKGYTEVVILDDFGNTKIEYMEEDEGAKQIMIKNNQVCYAPKAGVEEKGRVPVQPKLLLINTNNSTMLSEMSVCPYSRYRRGDIYIRATVRKEFARCLNEDSPNPVYKNEVDDAKIRKEFGRVDSDGNFSLVLPTLPNMWDITLQKPYMRSEESTPTDPKSHRKKVVAETVAWQTITHNNVLCANMDIFHALDVVCDLAQRFYTQQKSIVHMNKQMDMEYSRCDCGCNKSKAFCLAQRVDLDIFSEPLESHGLFEYTSGFIATKIYKFFTDGVLEAQLFQAEKKVVEYSTKWLVKNYNRLYNDAMFELFTWLPLPKNNSWLNKKVIDCLFSHEIRAHALLRFRLRIALPFFVCMCFLIVSYRIHYLCFGVMIWVTIYVSFLCMATYVNLLEDTRREVVHELGKRSNSLVPLSKATKEAYGKKIIGGLVAVSSIIIALKIMQKLYQYHNERSSDSLLRPTTMVDIEKRNKIPNEWVPHGTSDKLERGTATEDQLTEVTRKNLFTGKVMGATEVATSLCLVLTNGCLAIPKHNLVKGWKSLRMSRGEWYVDIPLDAGNVYLCPNKDVAFIYSAKIQGRDLTKHIRENDNNTSFNWIYSTPIRLLGMSEDNKKVDYFEQSLMGSWKEHIVATEGFFPGWQYTMKEKSYRGLCGAALIIRDNMKYCIGGIHLAGNTVSGAGASICLKDISAFRQHVADLPDIADRGVFPTKIIGDDSAVIQGSQPDSTSPLLWSEGDHHYSYIGQCKGKSSFQSVVKPSLITKSVTRHTGIPNNFGPPRAKPWWRPYILDLEKRSNQPIGFGIGELRDASREYVDNFISAYKTAGKDVKEYFITKPLTRQQVLFGIDGYRFIDRMKFSTAIGFPYCGAKKKFCTMDGENVIDLEPWVWEETEKVMDVLKLTRRAYQPFKTSLKDEITKQFKDDGTENTKVRVFTCAPITMQILIRKYYLPVAAILSHFPLVSEQAVGINASGPDFHELITYIKENGDKSGYVAGDFSKYDLGMSADAILAAFKVMRDIARGILDYTDEDLCMMDMIANEVANPVIAYNGDMIQMTGSNPSGQNMTVYINGIVNSLYHRCVYNRLKREHNLPGTFSSECRATFYGDDSLFAPSTRVAHVVHFNSLNRIFGDVEIKYTPANKTDSAPDLIPIEEIDFLKRKPVYNPDIGAYMGALSFDSIVKSLHCSATDTLPPDVAASVNLDSSIREMFNHGEVEYEKWRSIVREIATEHGIENNIQNLDKSYSQYFESYMNKYVRNVD